MLVLVAEHSGEFDAIHSCTAFHRIAKLTSAFNAEQRAQLAGEASYATLCQLLSLNLAKMDAQGKYKP